MTTVEPTTAAWRKSSRSQYNGNCLEILIATDAVQIRDSKDVQGPTLSVSPRDWSNMIGAIVEGTLHRDAS